MLGREVTTRSLNGIFGVFFSGWGRKDLGVPTADTGLGMSLKKSEVRLLVVFSSRWEEKGLSVP